MIPQKFVIPNPWIYIKISCYSHVRSRIFLRTAVIKLYEYSYSPIPIIYLKVVSIAIVNIFLVSSLVFSFQNITTAPYFGTQFVLVIFNILLPINLSTLGLYICVYIYLNSIPLYKCQSQRGKSTNCVQPPSPLKGFLQTKINQI